MVVWEEKVAVKCETGLHAVVTYDAVAAAGPPARPLEFPTPTVYKGIMVTVPVLDHRSGYLRNSKNVLMRVGTTSGGTYTPPDRAYLMRKQVSKSVYGVVYQCVVLKRRTPPESPELRSRVHRISQFDDPIRDEDVEWISTEQYVAAKVSKWSRIRQLRGRHLEDPIKEIAALQLIGNYHSNVTGSIEALQDEVNLYALMPYWSGGDLYERVFGAEHRSVRSDRTSRSSGTDRFSEAGARIDEALARHWFRQLLEGLFHLQKKGCCHRDLSLENIKVDDHDRLRILDLGMALRVPYTDPNNFGCVTDVSAGTIRRLIVAQGQGGKLMYVAPEVMERDDAFDGFAIDLWSAGVILFVLLVGVAPFRWANNSDKRFVKISKGHLRRMLAAMHVPLTEEACDLLQNMMWRDPRKRLTLSGVMQHPWVLNKKFTPDVSAHTTHGQAKGNHFHKPVMVRGLAHV